MCRSVTSEFHGSYVSVFPPEISGDLQFSIFHAGVLFNATQKCANLIKIYIFGSLALN